MTKTELLRRARAKFGGKPYALSYDGPSRFLVLAYPKVSRGEWSKNCKPMTFNYLKRTCIANGKTWAEVWASALYYAKLQREDKALKKDLAAGKRDSFFERWERIIKTMPL